MPSLSIVHKSAVLAAAAGVLVLASACGGGSASIGGGKPRSSGTVPKFTTGTTATFTAGRSGDFGVSASGSSAKIKITESGVLPAGLDFRAAGNGTAVISGTPAGGAGGRYTLSLIASDFAGQGSQTLTISVDQAPMFTKSDGTRMYILPFKYDNTPISTTGYPPAKFIEIGSLPSGIMFKDLGGGKALISGRPGIGGANGARDITILAQNSAGSATLNIQVLG